MAHYRKIDVQVWNDGKVAALRPASKLAFLFLVTHPNMTSIGAMRATLPGLAAELGVSQKDFQEVIDAGMAKFDEKACCILVPKFVKYQGAESPNVIRNWVKQLGYIPESHLKSEALTLLEGYVQGMKEGFQKAFREAFHDVLQKDIPNTVSSKQLAVIPSLPSHEGEILDLGVDVDPRTGEIRGVA